ncbi:MAG: hypothetical protein HYX68_14545 [Planctomycetes bacterium]|nr:hypothetical protein [Planctomycetota bacterium]
MSSPTPEFGTPPAAAPAPQSTPPSSPLRREIRVVSHCSLFYWWPVWVVGFMMWIITMFSGHVMAIVPSGSTAVHNAIPKEDGKKDDTPRDAIVVPAKSKLPHESGNKDRLENPHLAMSNNKNLGVLFVAVLLLVVVITNIPLRGLWSVIVIVFVISLAIIFALLEWWTIILSWLSILDIRINAAGYFVISLVLFILWLVVMLLFDRQIYMVFTPGQMRVCLEIGDAETAYDTSGMTIQKQRSDLFRHWILGLGSGDLIVKTAGSQTHEFHMPNVLFIGRKVKEIEEMLRSRQVVTGGS